MEIFDATVQRIDRHTVEICWVPKNRKPAISIFTGKDMGILVKNMLAGDYQFGCLKISDLDPLIRYYYQLENDTGVKLMTAERRVPVEGAINFRDIGGYQTANGRRVRWGRVFRSDGLSRLTDNDHQLIQQMGIKRVIDFRTPSEILNSPDYLPEDSGLSYVNLAVTHGQIDFVEALNRLKEGDTRWLTPDFMVNGYINNIENSAHVWGKVIQDLALSDGEPMLFHCTGGKDRTGACAALILLLLDVPEETVIADHQLSNIYIADLLPKIDKLMAAYGIDPDVVFPYLTAPKNCILAMLDHIRDKYGSAAEYLEKKAGINSKIQRSLKDKLLM